MPMLGARERNVVRVVARPVDHDPSELRRASGKRRQGEDNEATATGDGE